jgi:hypothetical protein
MSATDRAPTEFDRIDVLINKDQETVTFVADHTEDETVSPTEWITVPTEATVDLKQCW